MNIRNYLCPLLPLAVLLVAGCAAPDWQSQLATNHCDPVIHELDGVGSTRAQAMNNAVASAITIELGAIVSSEMVLEHGELVVYRQGQVYRGMVDSAFAIGEPQKIAGSDQISLLTRVTVCRNTIPPNQQTRPSSIAVTGRMAARTQAMLDASDTRNEALVHRQSSFKDSVSTLLDPFTGPDLHRLEVISSNPTDVFTNNASINRPKERADQPHRVKRIGFRVLARVSLEPQVRSQLEQLLDQIAIGHHTPRIFGLGYQRILRKHGFAFVDQRIEQRSNTAIHPSDFQQKPWETSNRSEDLWLAYDTSRDLQILDFTIIKGLIETRPDDAIVLRQHVASAIASFVERGLTLVGRSEQGQPIVQIPLFDNNDGNRARLKKVTLYPESAHGRRHDTNAATFEWLDSVEQTWLARQTTPLRLLTSGSMKESVPALRRGASYLEIDLSVPRDSSIQIDHFTLESGTTAMRQVRR